MLFFKIETGSNKAIVKNGNNSSISKSCEPPLAVFRQFICHHIIYRTLNIPGLLFTRILSKMYYSYFSYFILFINYVEYKALMIIIAILMITSTLLDGFILSMKREKVIIFQLCVQT